MLNKINFLTAGESHGQGLMGIIQGLPSNLEIDKQYIEKKSFYIDSLILLGTFVKFPRKYLIKLLT